MKNGVRSWLVTTLSPSTIDRISIDLGGGVGLAVAAGLLIAFWSPNVTISGVAIGGAAIGVIGLLSALFAFGVIDGFLLGLMETTPSPRRSLLRDLLRALVIVLYALGLILFVLDFMIVFIAVPPAALLLVFGIWACLLTQRRVRASRYRLVRYATDVLIAALTGLDLLVLFDHDLLATLPAAGLLFPVGAWFSIQTWRVMAGSRRSAVRAGADIALSLLLGIDLVLFVVWGANLLGLPEAEIAVLRGTLERVGSVADLPWPLWVGLYVLLAGASLTFARWPEALAVFSRWFQRLHLVPSIDAGRRVLSGVHIGLLVTALIAVSAPASLEAALRGPLKAKYTVALQRELESAGEQAAYEEIRRQFTPSTASASSSAQPLVTIVTKIHNISSPPPGTSDATSTERDLARGLGQIQATTLHLAATHSVLSAHQAVTDLAHFDPPIRDAGDLTDRLDRLDTQQEKADTEHRLVDQAAELAATVVANLIQVPGLGENEIVQIIREYLSGLVESSPLKTVFAAWAERLPGDPAPPRAEEMVIPNPAQLKQAALAELTQLVDPSTLDQVQTRTQAESSAAAAVDLVNEVRYLDENTGPCDGCQQLLRPGEEHYHGPDDHPGQPGEPIEPVEPPVEPPHIRIPIGW